MEKKSYESEASLQVADGAVVLGEWQSIIMAEFDGPRERSIRIQVMGIGE